MGEQQHKQFIEMFNKIKEKVTRKEERIKKYKHYMRRQEQAIGTMQESITVCHQRKKPNHVHICLLGSAPVCLARD